MDQTPYTGGHRTIYTYTFKSPDGTEQTITDDLSYKVKENGKEYDSRTNLYRALTQKGADISLNGDAQKSIEELKDYTTRLYALSQVVDTEPLTPNLAETLARGELTGSGELRAHRLA